VQNSAIREMGILGRLLHAPGSFSARNQVRSVDSANKEKKKMASKLLNRSGPAAGDALGPT
jgi:hypothetical protein